MADKSKLKIETDQDLRDSTAFVLEGLLNGDIPVSQANAFARLARNIISMNGQRIKAQIYNSAKKVRIPQLDSSKCVGKINPHNQLTIASNE